MSCQSWKNWTHTCSRIQFVSWSRNGCCTCRVHEEVDRSSGALQQCSTGESWAKNRSLVTSERFFGGNNHRDKQTCSNFDGSTFSPETLSTSRHLGDDERESDRFATKSWCCSHMPCAMQKKMVLTSGDSDLVISWSLVRHLMRYGNFGKYPDSPSGGTGLLKGLLRFTKNHESPVLTGTHIFLHGEVQQCGQNMHCTASDLSQEMLVKLILPASAISMVNCLPAYLREVAEYLVASSSPSKMLTFLHQLQEGNFCDGSRS